MKVIDSVKVGDKLMVRLPEDVKEKLNIQKGDFLVFYNDKDQIILGVRTKEEVRTMLEKR